MIKINLSPVRSEVRQPNVYFAHPILTVDSTPYDLSQLPDGATAHHSVLGTVERIGDDYQCTLSLTHGPNAPESTRYPQPIEVTQDGPVELPDYDKPEVADDMA